nr:uncharacterized protein LOC124814438 [Hydra vulgaris]
MSLSFTSFMSFLCNYVFMSFSWFKNCIQRVLVFICNHINDNSNNYIKLTMTTSKNTRLSMETKLSTYLVRSKDLIPSEVPTLRDILKKGLLIQEALLQEDVNRRNI